MKKSLKFYIITSVLCLLLITMLFVGGLVIAVKAGLFGHIPDLEEIYKYKNVEETRVYASGGELIGTLYRVDRSNVKFEKIPKHVIHALIATEDSRFFEHSGVDFVALARVFTKTLLFSNESSGGGSTISQQLAKNLFGRKRYPFLSMPITKIREMIIASRIEELYSKEEILCLYLNTVCFGENIYGIENASLRYFSRHCDKLTIDQGALLIGTLKGNTLYNPRVNPERAVKRRTTVLNQMLKYGYINEAIYQNLCEIPLGLKYTNVSEYRRKAGYFLDYVQGEAQDIIDRYNKVHDTKYDLLTDGLKIQTTLDYQLQQSALRATNRHILQLQRIASAQIRSSQFWRNNPSFIKQWRKQRSRSAGPVDSLQSMNVGWGMDDTVLRLTPIDSFRYASSRLQAAVFATDPRSGAIKAWIGGVNYITAPFNRVLSKRQVGSTFKPIVYYSAINQGVDPCEKIKNEREVYSEYNDWSPQNADSVYGGFYTLKGGLANSVNTITAKLLFRAGIDNVIQNARLMGITSDLPNDPSIALGTASISLLEMVGAYAIIANKGRAYDNYAITQITDSKGKVLYKNSPHSRGNVIDETSCEKLIDVMKAVADSGTAQRLRNKYGFKAEVACKTGTTQDNVDGWFIGCTPRLAMGVWVGFDNPAIHFFDTKTGQGANTSLPIWAMTMNGAGLKYTVPFYLDENNCSTCKLFFADRGDIREQRRLERDAVRAEKDSIKELKRIERKTRREERKARRNNQDIDSTSNTTEQPKKKHWWQFGK